MHQHPHCTSLRVCPAPRSLRSSRQLRGEPAERGFRIIAGDAIGFQDAAPCAPVNDAAFAVFEYPERDGFHGRPAEVGTITRADVNVETPQALWTMVAVVCAIRPCRDNQTAVRADKSESRTDFVPGFSARSGWPDDILPATHRFLAFFSSRLNLAICLPHSRDRCRRISAVTSVSSRSWR